MISRLQATQVMRESRLDVLYDAASSLGAPHLRAPECDCFWGKGGRHTTFKGLHFSSERFFISYFASKLCRFYVLLFSKLANL